MSKLPLLKQRIKARIQRVKHNMHPAHNMAYTETVNAEIQTLSWALNEINSLRDHSALKQCQHR